MENTSERSLAKESLGDFLNFVSTKKITKQKNYKSRLRNSIQVFLNRLKRRAYVHSHQKINLELEKNSWDFLTEVDPIYLANCQGVGKESFKLIIDSYKELGIKECTLFGNKPFQVSAP